MPGYNSVILQGDYSGPYERQQMALAQHCIAVVECHFNAADDSSVQGGEVHYQVASPVSRDFATAMWAELAAIGLPPHGDNPVKSTQEAPRSQFIAYYDMPTILLEPLFIPSYSPYVFSRG